MGCWQILFLCMHVYIWCYKKVFYKESKFQSRKPPGYPKWMILLMPFDTAMWVATSTMCGVVFLFLMIYTSRYPVFNELVNGGPSLSHQMFPIRLNINREDIKLYDLCMFCVGSLIDDCQGHSLWDIKTAKLRIFMILYLLGTFVITNGYRSALFSMLTAPLVSICNLFTLILN